MNDLLKKYLSGKINRDELERLREISDSELTDSMQEDWDQFFSPVSVPDRESRWKKILLSSAAVLIPLLVLSTILLWNRSNVLSAQDIVVTTGGNGERATVILPDGSEVSLNSNSRLSYKPEDFLGDTRSVTFEGEGFFTVSKSKDKSFTVHTSLVRVNVMGTSFNLLSRETDKTASLFLETGSVELKSIASGNSIKMKPGEFARLDAEGVNFILELNKKAKEVSAWRFGEFVFINQRLKDVAKSLEYNFNTDILFDSPEVGEIHFTGTLPNSNMLETIRILELSLGLRCTQKGESIIFSAK